MRECNQFSERSLTGRHLQWDTHLQMSQNAGVARTRVVAIILVNTELEALGVDVVRYSFDATRKSGPVRLEVSSPVNEGFSKMCNIQMLS